MRIDLQRAKTGKSRVMIAQEEEDHANGTVRRQQEQLSWVQIQLALAEEERDRFRDERQGVENQIKNTKSPF